MIRSMTGFGIGEGKIGDNNLRVEIKSFNHRFFEFTGRIPQELMIYEEEIKKSVKKKIHRGSVNIILSSTKKALNEKAVYLDAKLAKKYSLLAQQLKKNLSIKQDLGVKDFLSFPGVVVHEEPKEDLKKHWNFYKKAIEKAVNNLIVAKEREGKDLLKDILKHIDLITKSVNKIEQRAGKVVSLYKKRFKMRLKEILRLNPSRDRIEEEVALFARNADISEEIIRIKSHLNNFRQLLKSATDVGRKLDFVAQELYREANTIGAKGSDFIVSKEVVEMKSEIEKIREQAQNVE